MNRDNTQARRLTNLSSAKMFAKIGLYVFVSNGKTPLIPRFNKIDTQLTQDEREQAIEEFEARHGKPPVHVGATKDLDVIKKMFHAYPDAVWSIACGPSKIVVIDADSKDNGPELIGKHFDKHGLPVGCVVVPTQSGGRHYIFRDPEGKFTNSAGLLKKDYGCDVRGVGGQYIAPGRIREDGKTYGTKKDMIAFARAVVHGTLPELPGHIVELIGTRPEGEAPLSDSDPVVKSLLEQLGADEWPDFSIAFDPAVGWSLESLREHAPDFGELYDAPGADRSTNRFNAARYLVGADPDMTVCEYAAFCEAWDGAGDKYDARQLAREFASTGASHCRRVRGCPILGRSFSV